MIRLIAVYAMIITNMASAMPNRCGPPLAAVTKRVAIYRTDSTKMKSRTGFALLLSVEKQMSGSYKVLYAPIDREAAQTHPGEMRNIEQVDQCVISGLEFGGEMARWIQELRVGEALVSTTEQSLSYSQAKFF